MAILAHRPGRPGRILEIRFPATSANLGPAFDAAALAFRLYLTIQAKTASNFSIRARGVDADVCGNAENHLVLGTYNEVLGAEGKPVVPLALQLTNEIPIGKGCGSSAAARLAGIVLAVGFGNLQWTDARIIGEASRREHHPDNAAACWLGGVAVARAISDTEAEAMKLTPKGKWPMILVVPDDPLSTEEARRLLPSEYARQDATRNIQNSLLLLASFIQGRSDTLAGALEDYLHQPYRASLCPLLPVLKGLTGTLGILGAALSGAGPSVLVFVDPKASLVRVKSAIKRHLQSRGLHARILTTSIADRGAKDP